MSRPARVLLINDATEANRGERFDVILCVLTRPVGMAALREKAGLT